MIRTSLRRMTTEMPDCEYRNDNCNGEVELCDTQYGVRWLCEFHSWLYDYDPIEGR
jgi:hypothetical protein